MLSQIHAGYYCRSNGTTLVDAGPHAQVDALKIVALFFLPTTLALVGCK